MNYRTAATGDVSAAAQVAVDKVPSLIVVDVDAAGDSSAAAGHQLPLVVRETGLPGRLSLAVDDWVEIILGQVTCGNIVLQRCTSPILACEL